jgi:hypothetical protein
MGNWSEFYNCNIHFSNQLFVNGVKLIRNQSVFYITAAVVALVHETTRTHRSLRVSFRINSVVKVSGETNLMSWRWKYDRFFGGGRRTARWSRMMLSCWNGCWTWKEMTRGKRLTRWTRWEIEVFRHWKLVFKKWWIQVRLWWTLAR